MKSLRVVAYAINGRGMGHLVRQLAILRWIRRMTAMLDVRCECWVLTSSEADTLARREGFCALKLPSKAMMRDAGIEPARYLAIARGWVLNTVAGLQPDLLVVDTFPGGSFGELLSVIELAPRRVLVARRVREAFASEDAYAALLPLYHRHIVPDDRDTGPILIRERDELLTQARARDALGIAEGRRAVYVSMGGGGDVDAPGNLPRIVDRLRARDWHVVVGAGPLYEGPERRGDGITWIDRYVPLELLGGVDAAVSAAGYNSFHELMFAGVPTVFLPLPRIADDQRERAERAEAAGAARVARTIEEIPELLEAPGSALACRTLVPRNGARAAALAALATVLPEQDLAMIQRLLTDKMLRILSSMRGAAGGRKALELIRLLAGGTPDELAARKTLRAELVDRGELADDTADDRGAGDRIEQFLELLDAHAIPFDRGVALLKSLRRKFPPASEAQLLDSARQLFAGWARFDDWMGAVSLLRAVPTQRTYGIEQFTRDLLRWLEGHDDLFDALRDFSRVEAGGQRTVVEALRLLADEQVGVPRAGEGRGGG